MRVLVLVISDNSLPVYARNREAIRRCVFNSHPDFDCYFVDSDPNIDASRLDGDTFISKSDPGFKTIVQKTSDAIEFFTATTDYDFVLRTNVSSFWVFSLLSPVIKTLPKAKCIHGVIADAGTTHFVSGAGLLMSVDIAKQVCKTWRHYDCQYDDIAISKIAIDAGATLVPGIRMDLPDGLACLSSNWAMEYKNYHYRVKCINSDRRHEEADVMCKLYEMHANNTLK